MGTDQIAILGIPLDENSSFMRGCNAGPSAIREAWQSPASSQWSELGVDLQGANHVVDVGDVELPAGEGGLNVIQNAVQEQLLLGRRVISLGGDHSVTLPILRAYAKRFGPLNVLQWDAHSDLYDEFEGQRFSHACPFARACEENLIRRLVQVGIRTLNQHQREQAERFRVEVVEMRHFSLPWVPDFDGPFYCTLDLDALDPAFAPGISHYEPGGLNVRQILQVIQAIEQPWLGADIVELNPVRDRDGQTAMVAGRFLKEMLGRMITLPLPA